MASTIDKQEYASDHLRVSFPTKSHTKKNSHKKCEKKRNFRHKFAQIKNLRENIRKWKNKLGRNESFIFKF